MAPNSKPSCTDDVFTCLLELADEAVAYDGLASVDLDLMAEGYLAVGYLASDDLAVFRAAEEFDIFAEPRPFGRDLRVLRRAPQPLGRL